MISLNEREAEILAVLSGAELFGRELRDVYESRLGKKLPLGSLYTTLDRMEQRGIVSSRVGNADREARNGNRRKHFRVTPSGATALEGYLSHAQRLLRLSSGARPS